MKGKTMAKPTKHVPPAEAPPTPETLAAQAMRFLDTIEREIQEGHGQAWIDVLTRAAMLVQPLANGQLAVSGKGPTSKPSENSDNLQIEQVYNDLQHHLMEARRSVAQNIAAQKQLEVQLERTREQAETWAHRANNADQQKQTEASEQARLRQAQYDNAAAQVEKQLIQQKNQVLDLRQKLTELEIKVQKAYDVKQNLLTRSQAARAAVSANNLLDQAKADDALAQLKKLEEKVVELEERATKETPAATVAKENAER